MRTRTRGRRRRETVANGEPMNDTAEPQVPVENDGQSTGAERRRHPRVYESLPVEASLRDGQTLKLTLLNASAGGVQLGCDDDQLRRIRTEGYPALHGQTVEIGIRATMPSPEHAADTVSATCRLVYARRITQHRYCLGMQFTDLKGQSREALSRYLRSAPHRT